MFAWPPFYLPIEELVRITETRTGNENQNRKAEMNWQPYPKYKESSVQWLGKVPEHWKKLQLSKCINAIKDGTHGTFERIPSDYTLLSAKNVTDKGIITGEYESSISEKDYKSITANGFPRKYDILITIVGTIGRACVFIEEKPIAFQRSVAFLRLNNQQEPRYFSYQICSKPFQEQLVVRTKSAAQGGVYMGDLVKIPVLAPLLYEQTAIADFLDRETGRIDTLVAKNKKLIELLKEERSALISRTVTRGLPEDAAIEYGLEPHTRFKDSGVEWLGDVPEGWDVFPLRRLVQYVKTGKTPSGAEEHHFENDGFNWFTPSDFSEKIYLGKSNRALSDEGLADVRIFPSMTVMLIGIGATMGKVGLSQWGSSCNQQINAIVCDFRLNPVFATYYLKTMSDFIVKCGKYTTIPIINQDETKNLIFTVPSIEEQQAIASFLDRKTAKIDKLIEKVVALITRLQEYRIAIITDAVTGKIDVREIAA